MATVLATSQVTPKALIWTNPSNVGGDVTGIPTARLSFYHDFTVAAKLTSNTVVIEIICQLPQNFAYRLDGFILTHRSDLAGSIGDYSYAWLSRILDNNPQGGGVYLYDLAINKGIAPMSAAVNQIYTAGTFGYEMSWNPPGNVDDRLLVASNSTTEFYMSLVNSTSNATAETFVNYEISFLQYTIDAVNSWALNTPSLTKSSD